MRACIVSSRLLHQEGTWSADHFLGREMEMAQEVVTARTNVRRAITKYRNAWQGLADARQRLADESKRIEALQASKDLVLL